MRYLVKSRPTHPVVAWQRAMNRFFNEAAFHPINNAPAYSDGWNSLALDVADHDDNLSVTASLPGFSADEVEVAIEDGILTIKAETEASDEKTDEANKYYLRERRRGAARRSVRLPVDVDADATEASFENGILSLTLPKAAAAQPKRIEVKTR